MIDVSLVIEALEYCAEDGSLTWKERPEHHFTSNIHTSRHNQGKWNNKFPGTRADRVNPFTGYRAVVLFGRKFPAHRLAWAISHGKWPTNEIDHINGDRSDNRIVNLRVATPSQNKHRSSRHNKSGLRGVVYSEKRGKWIAQIRIDGKQTNLGGFDCPAAASFRYQIEADKQFGEYARAI